MCQRILDQQTNEPFIDPQILEMINEPTPAELATIDQELEWLPSTCDLCGDICSDIVCEWCSSGFGGEA